VNPYHRFDQWLSGTPNETLGALLVMTGLVLIAIGLWGPPPLRALALAYAWLP
jgi:hypothetical protein